MENKINVADLLRDCPKGMELNCKMYEDVYFDYVDELQIIHCYIERKLCKTSITFNQYGTPNSDVKSKCVIFPKGKTTWEEFVPPVSFKDGDIITCTNRIGSFVAIYKEKASDTLFRSYVVTSLCKHPLFKINSNASDYSNPRFATEEEKAKLFQAIKDNGYKWDAEMKRLRKLAPEFKQGDIVTCGHNSKYTWTCILKEAPEKISDNYFISDYCSLDSDGVFLPYDSGADSATWIRWATEEEEEKLFEAIKRNSYEWIAETNTFKLVETNVIKENLTVCEIVYDEIDFNRCPCADKVQLILGDDFEIKMENGKTFVVRKQQKYPQTYEECLNVLGKTMNSLDSMNGYKSGTLMHFQQLLICRDAYWKIAGEQMGLGKPWKPDWNVQRPKYTITVIGNQLIKHYSLSQNYILSFPTEEIRDTFKKNFASNIKLCETLL